MTRVLIISRPVPFRYGLVKNQRGCVWEKVIS